MGFVDHGSGGTGEQVAALLRLGSAGSNTAAHHITGNSDRAGPTPQAPSACSVDTARSTLVRTEPVDSAHGMPA
jgi:hypothetical protein